MGSKKCLDRKQWSEVDMIKAITAFRNGSCNKSQAAREFNVPRKTLGDRLRRRIKESSKKINETNYEKPGQLIDKEESTMKHAKSEKKKLKYDQRYRRQWQQLEEFKDWLTGVKDDEYRAFCKACKCLLYASRFDLRKHARTKKHERHVKLYTSSLKVNPNFDKTINTNDKFSDDEEEDQNIEFALYDPECERKRWSHFSAKSDLIEGPQPIQLQNLNTINGFNVINDELVAFSQYVASELRTGKHHLAIQRAKLEISTVLFNLSAGTYDPK